MKLSKLGTAAALSLAGIALAPSASSARSSGGREQLLVGTWNLQTVVEGCKDATDGHRGELWIFDERGGFQRVGREGTSRQAGRWLLRHKNRELVLEVDDADGRRHTERFPIVALDGKRLELLSPTDVQEGLVIRQERYTAFFHS